MFRQPKSRHMSINRFKSVLMLCVVSVALSGLSPVSVTAEHPQSAASAYAVTEPAKPQREVFGFALASSLSDPTFGYTTWNFSLLSTVAFFGLHIQNDGTYAADQGATVWNSSQLRSMVTAAHANGTRVLLTIIEQDFSAGTPNMCAALTNALTTVTNTVNEVKAKGVDGVNVDYEGLNGNCGNSDPSWTRDRFTFFVSALRNTLPAGTYLSVDTYAGAAADPLNFFNVPGIAQFADSMFVMAYDLEYSNWSRPPLNCSSFCLGPTAPLSGYYYNDTNSMAQYLAVVAASKVILGVPYYGRKACVAGPAPNPSPIGGAVADTYLDASGESAATGVKPGTFAAHRDPIDPAGQERSDTWFNTTMNCTRELYWDDATSLGLKYELVNTDNLRGVGLWNLNYGGGAPELWQALAYHFATTTPWTSLGGAVVGGPDASSWSSSHLDAFYRGPDKQLWQQSWDGTMWRTYVLGGVLTSDPGAVSWGPNRVDVFARGTDNQLWHRWFDGTWHPWESLGGVLSSGPDVASWSSGRLDVFVRGTDNQLWHRWFDRTWHGWEPLGGVLASDPTAVSWGPNRIDIFVRGTDNAMWHKWWDNGRWYGWERLGGGLTSSPDAASCAAGRLDVFAMGTDSALWHRGFNSTAGWGQWQRMGGQWTGDPGTACLGGTSTVEVFERGVDGSLRWTNLPTS
jgi:spore germination protein YaaH